VADSFRAKRGVPKLPAAGGRSAANGLDCSCPFLVTVRTVVDSTANSRAGEKAGNGLRPVPARRRKTQTGFGGGSDPARLLYIFSLKVWLRKRRSTLSRQLALFKHLPRFKRRSVVWANGLLAQKKKMAKNRLDKRSFGKTVVWAKDRLDKGSFGQNSAAWFVV
jgi:hypothetical protein